MARSVAVPERACDPLLARAGLTKEFDSGTRHRLAHCRYGEFRSPQVPPRFGQLAGRGRARRLCHAPAARTWRDRRSTRRGSRRCGVSRARRYGEVAYVAQGAGPAVLLLHGFPLNGFQWRGAIERPGAQARCIAPDFLGMGHSSAARGQPVGPDAQVLMLIALLDELRIERAHVIANDSGGAVAQLLVGATSAPRAQPAAHQLRHRGRESARRHAAGHRARAPGRARRALVHGLGRRSFAGAFRGRASAACATPIARIPPTKRCACTSRRSSGSPSAARRCTATPSRWSAMRSPASVRRCARVAYPRASSGAWPTRSSVRECGLPRRMLRQFPRPSFAAERQAVLARGTSGHRDRAGAPAVGVRRCSRLKPGTYTRRACGISFCANLAFSCSGACTPLSRRAGHFRHRHRHGHRRCLRAGRADAACRSRTARRDHGFQRRRGARAARRQAAARGRRQMDPGAGVRRHFDGHAVHEAGGMGRRLHVPEPAHLRRRGVHAARDQRAARRRSRSSPWASSPTSPRCSSPSRASARRSAPSR